jgi:hypothetical protein
LESWNKYIISVVFGNGVTNYPRMKGGIIARRLLCEPKSLEFLCTKAVKTEVLKWRYGEHSRHGVVIGKRFRKVGIGASCASIWTFMHSFYFL